MTACAIEDFRIDNVRARFARTGDLFKPMAAKKGRVDLSTLASNSTNPSQVKSSQVKSQFPIPNSQFPIPNSQSSRSAIGNRQSAICNLQSAICNPSLVLSFLRFPGGTHVSVCRPRLAGRCPRAVRRRALSVSGVRSDRADCADGSGARRPEFRPGLAVDVRQGLETGLRHERRAALAAGRRSLLVQLPDARGAALLSGGSAEEGEGAALRSRENGRRADLDHAAALRRPAPAVLEHQVQERHALRVRGLRAPGRRHRDDEEEDYERAAGGRGRRQRRRGGIVRSATAGAARRGSRRAAAAAAQPHPPVRVRPDHRDRSSERRLRGPADPPALGHDLTG